MNLTHRFVVQGTTLREVQEAVFDEADAYLGGDWTRVRSIDVERRQAMGYLLDSYDVRVEIDTNTDSGNTIRDTLLRHRPSGPRFIIGYLGKPTKDHRVIDDVTMPAEGVLVMRGIIQVGLATDLRRGDGVLTVSVAMNPGHAIGSNEVLSITINDTDDRPYLRGDGTWHISGRIAALHAIPAADWGWEP